MLTAAGTLTGPYAHPAQPAPSTEVALRPDGVVELAGNHGGQVEPSDAARNTPRIGFDSDVPRGGTSATNPGGDYPTGDRRTSLAEFYGAYVACPWLSAPITVTAATVTAGGVVLEPDDTADPDTSVDLADAPTKVRKLDALLRYVNPDDNIIQLLDGISADLDWAADSFTECVWCMGEIVALYPLDASTMSIDADEHGVVRGYWQVTDAHGKPVWFEPEQVIHVSERSPRGGLYGLGLVQRAFRPATTWLFADSLLRERMRKGDPPDIHVDAPLEQTDNEYKRWKQAYLANNVGSRNIGNPITTRGGFTIAELRSSSRADLAAIKTLCRDEIISLSGTPPNQVGIIESGNLGGGTGTSQWRSYMLNRVLPRRARIAEKLNDVLLKAFGIDSGWRITIRAVDYADDETQENIYINRLRTGVWNLNETRRALGLPPVDGGDEHLIVERSWVMAWDKMQDFARSWIVKNGGVNYPPETVDGFPPVNPNAPVPPGAPGSSPAPSPADDDPGSDTGGGDVDPGDEPDDDPGGDTSTARDTPGPGGRRTRRADPTERADDWLLRVAEHYRTQLGRPR